MSGGLTGDSHVVEGAKDRVCFHRTIADGVNYVLMRQSITWEIRQAILSPGVRQRSDHRGTLAKGQIIEGH